MSEYDPKRVKSGAQKRFFIDMLTKDIELLPAIADLVDNSVDGARNHAPTDDLTGFKVSIETSEDRFEITDNSGGMPVDIARNYAFHFGRPAEFKGVPGSVGQFGIGMKRAIFKLGSAFDIKSNWVSEGLPSTYFRVAESVPVWAEGDDWSFKFSELDENVDRSDIVEAGTAIVITPLHPSVREDLAEGSVLNQLKNDLSTRHQQSIIRGLEITVNGQQLSAHRPALQFSDDMNPINYEFVVPAEADGQSGNVRVRIVAGTVASQSAARDLDEGQAANFANTGDAGWYVFCNDRLLLAGDRSAFTGWGSAAAAYHPQYRNFRGYVYMDADDARFLPWNTTKTAVDRDSPVYRTVVAKMKTALVETQSLINRAKVERERVKELHQAGAEDIPETPLITALDDSRNVSIDALPSSNRIIAPPNAPLPPVPKPGPTTQRIQYQVELDRYERLSRVFETTNGSALGRATFDYVWKAETAE